MTFETERPLGAINCQCFHCDQWAKPGNRFAKGHGTYNVRVPQTLVPCACEKCDHLIEPIVLRNGATRRYIKGHQGKKYGEPSLIDCLCGCGEQCLDRDEHNNPRKYVPGHGYKARGAKLRNYQPAREHHVTAALNTDEIKYLESRSNGKPLGRVLRELFFENRDLGEDADRP